MALYPIVGSGRRILDGNGSEYLVSGRTAWGIMALTPTLRDAFLDDCVARGVNTIECQIPHRAPQMNNPPFDSSGNKPFNNTLGGGTWSGTLAWSGNSNAPDFNTPNASYWSSVDGLFTACASRNILIQPHFAYLGQGGGSTAEGWFDELTAIIAVQGDIGVQNYAAFVANRYKSFANVMYGTAGDTAAGFDPENDFILGVQSVSGQASGPSFTSQRAGGQISTDGVGALGLSTTFNGGYDEVTSVGQARRAQAFSTRLLPAYTIEEPYDEEAGDGTGFDSVATQPVRRWLYWNMLNAVNGIIYGNGYIWPFNLSGTLPLKDDYRSHLATQFMQDFTRFFAFARSWPSWSKLQPSGLNGMATLVTSGGGTVPDGIANDDQTYVASAVVQDGTYQFVYFPPQNAGSTGRTPGTPATVTLAQMANKPIRGRWWSPTTAAFSTNASAPGTFTFNNSMTSQVFTPPTAITPDGDALLVLETQPPATPSTIIWCG